VKSESTFFLPFVVFCIPDQSRDAAPYSPTADVTTEEGNLQPPPPIPCFFGPITGQSRVEISMFETFPMC
jgi:transcription factor C subunit 6